MTDKQNFMENTMRGASHLLGQQRIAESKNLSDPVDQCLEIWSQAISNYEQASLQLAESEASFKAWEAAIKMAHMRNKASGVMAEGLVKRIKIGSNGIWMCKRLESKRKLLKGY